MTDGKLQGGICLVSSYLKSIRGFWNRQSKDAAASFLLLFKGTLPHPPHPRVCFVCGGQVAAGGGGRYNVYIQ